MAKKKKFNGFLWGFIIGAIIAVGAFYYYENYYKKTDLQRKAEKVEKKAQKQIEKASDKAKKLFE
jgi:hypothetical protein